MDLREAGDSGSRLATYVEGLASVIGHGARVQPLRDYCLGLLMSCERKSVEPMAAITAPARVSAQHQSLLHFIGKGGWSDETVLARVRDLVLPEMERHGPIDAWIIDDTGFPKQGLHSVGVTLLWSAWQAGQYPGSSVAVGANHHASLPVAYRLYLPKDWAADDVRRRKAVFQGDRLRDQAGDRPRADPLGLPSRSAARRGAARRRVWQQQRVAHGDHGVGVDICGRHSVEHHGMGSRHRAAATQAMVGPRSAADAYAPRRQASADHSQEACIWPAKAPGARSNGEKGSAGRLSSRFARVRVRVAHRDDQLAECRAEDNGRMARGRERADPNGSRPFGKISFRDLVNTAKLRWRIERDYQELKQEAGSEHFEKGRGWRGSTPPRHTMHRGLWLPDLREGDDSPLRTSFRRVAPATLHIRSLQTQRIRHCGLNATSQTQSQPCADD